MIIIEHNAATGEIVERDMTSNEVTEFQKVQAEATAAVENKDLAKDALLNRLGITAEEAALLLS